MTQPWIKTRLAKHQFTKSVGCVVSISLFFIGYFWTLHNPQGSVVTLPALAIDRAIPVLEWTVWIYFSLWVYICLPCCLIGSRLVLFHFWLGNVLLAFTGLAVFLLYPTAVPEWNIDWSQFNTLEFLKTKDNSGNACPSLHVAFAVFAWGWMHSLLKELEFPAFIQFINGLWALFIILSTMTTKQHLLIDVVFGVILGLLVYLINRAWMRHAGPDQ